MNHGGAATLNDDGILGMGRTQDVLELASERKGTAKRLLGMRMALEMERHTRARRACGKGCSKERNQFNGINARARSHSVKCAIPRTRISAACVHARRLSAPVPYPPRRLRLHLRLTQMHIDDANKRPSKMFARLTCVRCAVCGVSRLLGKY